MTHDDLNKYYQLINEYIDDYTEKHKINPSRLGKYLLNNEKLINFLKRKGLNEITKIDKVVKDVIEHRISIEKDIMTFESFKIFESNDLSIGSLKECLYNGIEKANISHEKLLADYFDVSLGQIDIFNSDKHIFNINNFNKKFNCVIFTEKELEIIKENIINYSLSQMLKKKISIDDISIELPLSMSEFIDTEKFEKHLSDNLDPAKVKMIINELLECKLSLNGEDNLEIGPFNSDQTTNFIGIV